MQLPIPSQGPEKSPGGLREKPAWPGRIDAAQYGFDVPRDQPLQDGTWQMTQRSLALLHVTVYIPVVIDEPLVPFISRFCCTWVSSKVCNME
jgi:hypothetical protein